VLAGEGGLAPPPAPPPGVTPPDTGGAPKAGEGPGLAAGPGPAPLAGPVPEAVAGPVPHAVVGEGGAVLQSAWSPSESRSAKLTTLSVRTASFSTIPLFSIVSCAARATLTPKGLEGSATAQTLSTGR